MNENAKESMRIRKKGKKVEKISRNSQKKTSKQIRRMWNRKKRTLKTRTAIEYCLQWSGRKILKTMPIQIEFDALTSFLCATNYGKEYLVWRKRWLDPIAEFRVMYTRQTMAAHLNFWHPIKPWNEAKKKHKEKTVFKTTMHKFITMHWECTSTALICSALLGTARRAFKTWAESADSNLPV